MEENIKEINEDIATKYPGKSLNNLKLILTPIWNLKEVKNLEKRCTKSDSIFRFIDWRKATIHGKQKKNLTRYLTLF